MKTEQQCADYKRHRQRRYNRESYHRCKARRDPKELRAYWREKRKRAILTPEQKAKNKARVKKWIALHPDASREYGRQKYIRMKSSGHFRARMACSGRLWAALRGFKKASNTETLIGCDWRSFTERIERQWLPGMSWSNYGNRRGQWSIDHIKPCAAFDLTDGLQQKICFHFSNLRPLWHSDNQIKGSLWEGVRHKKQTTVKQNANAILS